MTTAFKWDAFISHASEDKHFVEPLADELHTHGLGIWLDTLVLSAGDSLRRSIDVGLAKSRFGVVILSPAFFAKQWPQHELDGVGRFGNERPEGHSSRLARADES